MIDGPKRTLSDRFLDAMIELVPIWMGAIVVVAVVASVLESCR